MAVEWAGLCLGRLFSSQIRVAKGVSVYSVVNPTFGVQDPRQRGGSYGIIRNGTTTIAFDKER